MASSFNRYDIFSENIAKKVHDFRAAGDTLNVLLSNSAPNATTHALKSDATEIAAGFGYSAGGADTQNDISRAAAVTSVTGVDVTFTAAGGSIGPFRYVILYDDTPAAPLDPLIGWWDYASSITLNDGEQLVVDFGASMFTIG